MARLFAVLLNYQKEILAFMLASNMRVNVGRMFAPQATIRTLKFGFTTTCSTQMRVERTFVLVALRTLRAHVLPGLHLVHAAPHFNRKGWILEAASGQVAFQMARGRIWTIAETATVFINVAAFLLLQCCNRQQQQELKGTMQFSWVQEGKIGDL
jgi:hypothetical protein